MKFLSLRTVYRVFPIIKHSKTLGPRPVPTPGPIDVKKYSVCSSHQGLSTCQISWRLVEKWQRNRGSQVAVEKNKKEKNNNKKQNKNRKVFRLCRQTLIIIKTRIEPVGEPYREVCLSPWKGNWRISKNRIDWRNVLLSEKNYFHEKRMEIWHSLWPQKVTGSLEFSDLLYDPKGHGDLCGRFDVVYNPKL